MQFSTLVLFASTAMASGLSYRHVMPFMPRSLQARANEACGGYAPTGMTCCGASGDKFTYCNSTSTNSHCTNGDNMWWCCPEADQNCTNPYAGSNDVCNSNNGGCGDNYTCDKSQGGCVPKAENTGNGAAGATPQNSGMNSTTESSSSSSAAAAAATGAPASTNSSSSTGATTTPPPATGSASRLGGVSALALALMAGVLLL